MNTGKKIDYMIQCLKVAKAEYEYSVDYLENEPEGDDESIWEYLERHRQPNKALIRDNLRNVARMGFQVANARKVIDEKVKEVMTTAIERVNLDEYTVKLDGVLTEIINSTNLVDNKEILGNFKSLMTEPDKDTISLKEVFEKYKEYVSESVDTSELEVYTDDEPRYQNVTAEVTADTRNSIF